MRELRPGDAGPAVAEVRATLAGLGLLPSANGSGDPSVYDLPVEHAVRAFQQQRGLITDGVVGQATFGPCATRRTVSAAARSPTWCPRP